MSHRELEGSMQRGSPQNRYEYFGYAHVGGVDYKLYAFRDSRYPDELRWSLKLVPLPPSDRQVPA